MDISFSQKAKRITKLTVDKITKYPLISSVILCLLFFVMALVFCDPKYESNDDFWTDTLLSGAWTGECDHHMLFSNILIGYALKLFYNLFPYVSFYFVMLEIMGMVSAIVIVWLILKNCRACIGLLAAVVFMTCFSDDLFILVQFTKTAAVTIAAGGFLFLDGICTNTLVRRKVAVIFGASLFIVGSMLRLSSVFCVLPFLFIHFLLLVFKNRFPQIVIRLLLCLALLGVSFSLQIVNNFLWDMDPEYKEFRELNEYRSEITDFPKPAYEMIQPELEEIGITGVDYYMAMEWGFTDLSVFTPETIKAFAGVLKDYNSAYTNTLSNAVNNLYRRAYWSYPCVLGILFLVVLTAVIEKKRLFTIIASLLMCLALLLYFAYLGRVVYRVEYGILLSAFLVLACSLGRNSREIKIRQDMIYSATAVVMAAFLIYHSGTYFQDTAYKIMDEKSYSDYVDTVFSAPGYHLECYNVVVSKRRPHEELLSIIENDDSHFYLIDEEVLVNIQFDYKPWLRPVQNACGMKSHVLGGCYMMQFPAETYTYLQNGVDPIDPYKSLINDNIYVIDNEYYMLKLAYIRYHYYPEAQIELVGEASGRKIWKYYLPEN